jgi:uncharacterized protein YkwD
MSERGGLRALVAMLAVGAACGGAAANQPADHGVVEALEHHNDQVIPHDEPAAAFESRPADAHTLPSLEEPLRQRLVQGYQHAGAAAGTTVVADDRLDRAMDDLARALDEGQDPRSEAVEFLLGYHGIIEPYPELTMFDASPEAYDQVLAHALGSPQLPRATVVTVGVGIDAGRNPHKIVIALQSKQLDLAPVARVQPSGASFELTGSLLGAFTRPTLYVTLPSGVASERPLLTNGMAFHAAVACDHGDGLYQLEIFGSDAAGPRVLANFTVACGVAAPAVLAGRGGFVPARVSADAAEQMLFDLINKARAAAGLAVLSFDPALARVARSHSNDMLAHNFIGHISPTTGSPSDRVGQAGIAFSHLAENVGTASSPDEVHQGLMRSPGHRSAILDRQVTRVGVGVAVPPAGEHYRVVATELFR